MSLAFYISLHPHSYIFSGMTDDLPAGQFYSQSLDMAPASTLPTDFVLESDSGVPVYVYVNGRLAKTAIPTGGSDIVRVPLVRSSENQILVENGVDPAVNLLVTATYIATMQDVIARQIYKVAGSITEQYYYMLRSPWSSFIAEWLLPWKKELPDIRSLRTFAVKMLANTLYGESGQDGGVKDLVSAFTVNTPIVTAPTNPLIWQPELVQPLTSGDDQSGFVFDTWIANLCAVKWSSFLWFINNTPTFDLRRVTEEAIIIQEHGTERYEQHLFDNLGPGCGFRGILDVMGCMDNLTMAGIMELTAQPAWCYWANPFDMQVALPGIGGEFFDSGTAFDGGWAAFDSVYDLDPLTDYWVGAPTTKRFDFGGCVDQYTQVTFYPKDTECCNEGPDTKLFTTMRCDSTVASGVVPNHPVFGGDDPGLLLNPYFGVLGP